MAVEVSGTRNSEGGKCEVIKLGGFGRQLSSSSWSKVDVSPALTLKQLK